MVFFTYIKYMYYTHSNFFFLILRRVFPLVLFSRHRVFFFTHHFSFPILSHLRAPPFYFISFFCVQTLAKEPHEFFFREENKKSLNPLKDNCRDSIETEEGPQSVRDSCLSSMQSEFFL